jgi:hypothetical protein
VRGTREEECSRAKQWSRKAGSRGAHALLCVATLLLRTYVLDKGNCAYMYVCNLCSVVSIERRRRRRGLFPAKSGYGVNLNTVRYCTNPALGLVPSINMAMLVARSPGR